MREETAREVARMRELGQMGAQRIRRDAESTARSIADSGRRTIQAHLAAVATRLARELIVKNFEPADQTRLVREFLDTVRQEARP
jgi:F0F1-type ATP synthase membrane subunit b/b'